MLQALKRPADAKDSFATAADLDPDNAETWFDKGVAEFTLGESVVAQASFDKAIGLRPSWAKAWLNRALALADQGLFESALDDCHKALELDPTDAVAHRQLAITLWELQNIEQAEAMFKKSLSLEADNATSLANLASLYEQSNRLAEAQDTAKRALRIEPNNALARRVATTLKRRSGDAESALPEVIRLAAEAVSRSDKEALQFEVARLYEKLGDADKAYEHFAAANALQIESPAGVRIDHSKYLAEISSETNILANTPPTPQPLPDQNDTPPDPLFLIGFPRSGTTLLDQVLDSHPDIVVMDERPPLASVHERLSALEAKQGKPFTHLDDEQRQIARQFYFDAVNNFVPDYTDKTLIDKLPLGAGNIRVIQLLFPRARILFATRHPRDVVLSCFMQRFTLNKAMINFSTLAGAVNTYVAVMTLWQQAKSHLSLPVHTVRYEEVVRDFDNQIKAALSFTGVPWDERVQEFHIHAQNRHVRSASASQVTQPLYRTAVSRWQRYARFIEPHVVALRPFVESFGYSTDIREGK